MLIFQATNSNCNDIIQGAQAEIDSFVYCMPSHAAYASGQTVALGNQSSFQQQYLPSPGYIQENVPNVSETLPVNSWDSNHYARNLSVEPKVINVSEKKQPSSGNAGPSNSEDQRSAKTEMRLEFKPSPMLFEPRAHQFTSSDFFGQSAKPLKVLCTPLFVHL